MDELHHALSHNDLITTIPRGPALLSGLQSRMLGMKVTRTAAAVAAAGIRSCHLHSSVPHKQLLNTDTESGMGQRSKELSRSRTMQRLIKNHLARVILQSHVCINLCGDAK